MRRLYLPVAERYDCDHPTTDPIACTQDSRCQTLTVVNDNESMSNSPISAEGIPNSLSPSIRIDVLVPRRSSSSWFRYFDPCILFFDNASTLTPVLGESQALTWCQRVSIHQSSDYSCWNWSTLLSSWQPESSSSSHYQSHNENTRCMFFCVLHIYN